MSRAGTLVTLIGSAVLFAGCTFATDALWPSLTGGVPQATKKPVQKIVINSSRSQKAGVAGKSKGLSNKPPKLGVTNFRVKPATPGRNTGTVVGNKVAALRDDLRRLQTSVEKQNRDLQGARTVAVSYTHLTLPTIYSV